jgi:ribonuclease R
VNAATREEPEARSRLVGLVERRGRFLTARPFFERGRRVTLAAGGGGRKARGGHAAPREGDLVLLERAPSGRRGANRGELRIVSVIGRPDVARDVIEALMLDRGLRRSFDPAVQREARAARDRGAGRGGRRDLRDLPTFTIDPASARDFDDAISAERIDDANVRIWVHIADVAAHVAPNSAVDREAHRRATSVYVPGAVEPMLPEALSNEACSLVPGRDRAAVTVEMEMRLSGRGSPAVTRASFYRSSIRSDERLDYDRVDRIFAGSERARDPWATPLEAARATSAALQAARVRAGALAVESSEPEFSFDEQGHVTGLTASQQTESHSLIEHLMISANEQVAKLLQERKLGTLYRVHERPSADRVQRLVDQLASLDIATPPLPKVLTPQQAADAVGEISRLVDEHVRRTGRGRAALTSLVLRSLKQAYYSPENLGHAGLHSQAYCHFTSPIRRYPDLICHRALLAAVGAGEEAPPSARLPELGAWTSVREREAMTIERDADDVARCFVLERVLFEQGWQTPFDGEVTGVIGAGAFVSFGDGYEGMLPVRRLPGDWWELNEQGTILHGAHTGATLRLGDPVRVAVHRVEAPRGRVDLTPA